MQIDFCAARKKKRKEKKKTGFCRCHLVWKHCSLSFVGHEHSSQRPLPKPDGRMLYENEWFLVTLSSACHLFMVKVGWALFLFSIVQIFIFMFIFIHCPKPHLCCSHIYVNLNTNATIPCVNTLWWVNMQLTPMRPFLALILYGEWICNSTWKHLHADAVKTSGGLPQFYRFLSIVPNAGELSVTGRDPQREGNDEKRPDDCRQINEESWHLGKEPFTKSLCLDRATGRWQSRER